MNRDDRLTRISSAGASTPRLRVMNGPEAERDLPVPGFPCLIGRGGGSALLLADPDEPPTVSREHALLEVFNGSITITDQSRNGLWLDGRRLKRGERAALPPSAELRLGPTLLLHWCGTASLFPPPARATSSAVVAEPKIPIDGRAFLLAHGTLEAAWKRVELNRGAPGPDGITIAEFAADSGRRLAELRRQLASSAYQPMPPRLFAAPKRAGGVRSIAILTVQDRVVQQALHMALQPALEPLFPPCSYAYRNGFGAHEALRRVDALLGQGLNWIAETDIAGFFDNVRHNLLLDCLGSAVPDAFLLSLVARCLAACSVAPGMGMAQGAATSPLFSNLFLAGFDRHMLEGGWNPVRYGDDMRFLGASRGRAQAAIAEAEGYLRSRLSLALKPEKTAVRTLAQGFSFLGFRFSEAGRQAGEAAVESLENRLAESSPQQAVAVLRGWRAYYGSGSLPEERSHRFLALLGGRKEQHGRIEYANGRRRLLPCAGPITPELLQSHLRGEISLAAYLQVDEQRVGMLVLDLDRLVEPPSPQPSPQEDPARALAGELASHCREMGIPALLEESGSKGYHLWIPFSLPVDAVDARRLGRLLCACAGGPRSGVRVEVLPRHTDWPGPELGDAVTLPLGVHPGTARRCPLLDSEMEPMEDPLAAIDRLQPLEAGRLPQLLERLSSASIPTVSASNGKAPIQGPVGSLLTGCSVVRALADRARTQGHLRHTHNLILLYTVGRCGAEGAAFLHQTLSFCDNYRQEICERYLGQLDANHPPLTCRRIREWLEEQGEQSLCTCGEGRRSPIDLLPAAEAQAETGEGVTTTDTQPSVRPARRPAIRRESEEPVMVDESLWKSVQQDMFGAAGANLEADMEPEQEGRS
jgi:group II intron reverse transcriptase/maturase